MKALPLGAMKVDLDSVDIYAFVDPRNDTVKYIGQSTSVKTRYGSHIADAQKFRGRNNLTGWDKPFHKWLRELRQYRIMPDLYIIESVAPNKANAREKHWIKHFGLNNLTNIIAHSTLHRRDEILKLADKRRKDKGEI